jgi:serine/threonine-protein kinase
MHSGEGEVYAFENFRLDATKRLLSDANGVIVPLMPKAVEILLYLVRNAGTVVEKDDLMSEIWPDTVVEENNLTQNISILRRVLGEKHGENRFIVTVPGRGYKFVAEVRRSDRSSPASLTHPGSDADYTQSISDKGKQVHFTRQLLRDRTVLVTLIGVVLLALFVLGFYVFRQDFRPVGGSRVQSLAVLPFKPLVAENRDESLEMGITDTLISKLSGVEQIKVRPLAAVMRFGSLEQDPAMAGRELGVEAVLDGNIQIANNRVRISARLVRVSDGKQLWTDRFDEPSLDIFRLQDLITERVAAALQVPLGTRVLRNYTDNLEAYQLYQRGNYHASRLVLPEVMKGISYYEQAIEIDPGYALAYIGVANAHRALVLTSDLSPAEVMPEAVAAASRAVELDPYLAEAHVSLASTLFWYEWDWQSAEKHFLNAIELDPKSSSSRVFYAHLLSNTGRHEQAIEEIRKGRELEPVNLLALAIEGQVLTFAGRPDEALEILSRVVEMEPNFWLAHLFLSRLYIERAMYSEAVASASRARDLSGGNAEASATVGYALAKIGRREEAMKVQAELEKRSTERYVPAYALALVPNALGSTSQALDLLELSAEKRDALMVFLKTESKWDNLRKEPRFIELMKRMRFE